MMLDPQVNGYAGVDFQQDHLTGDDLLRAARAWRRDGGGPFFLTLITDEWSRMIARLRRLRALRDPSDELRGIIAGWHVEGPFLSSQPGFCGAHDPALMIDPQVDHVRELRDVLGDDPVLVTLAPERRGAMAAIAQARALNIRVSLGHTDASAEQLRAAVAAGAEGFTHLGNGCPQQLDRHDNILWRVLDIPGLMIGLIPDGLHVSPPLFRLMHRLVTPGRIYYTTDAMAAAGSPPGEYTIGRLRVAVGEDGVVRHPGQGNFAGSSLRPDQMNLRVRQMLGLQAEQALCAVENNAIRWLAQSGSEIPSRSGVRAALENFGESQRSLRP